MTDEIDRENDTKRLRLTAAQIVLNETASKIGFTDVVEANGRIWFELKTDIGLVYRVEDTILIYGDFTWSQDYFRRFQEDTAVAQRRILEAPQTILRFSADDPVPIYLCADRVSFLSFRDTIPPDWAGVYMTLQGAVIYDWDYVNTVFENREFGGAVFSKEEFKTEAVHELTHALIYRVIFGGDRDVYIEMRHNKFPWWLKEGFVVALFQYQGDANLRVLVEEKGYLPTLSFLQNPSNLDKDRIDSNVAYQASGGFVRDLAEAAGGYDLILAAMQRMVEERIPFEQALLELTNIDVYSFEETWRVETIGRDVLEQLEQAKKHSTQK